MATDGLSPCGGPALSPPRPGPSTLRLAYVLRAFAQAVPLAPVPSLKCHFLLMRRITPCTAADPDIPHSPDSNLSSQSSARSPVTSCGIY